VDAKLSRDLRARLEWSRRRFGTAHLRIMSFDFRAKIGLLRLQLEQRDHDLRARTDRLIRVKRETLERLSLQLDERSPLKVLERGYAIATDAAGNVLRDSAQVAIGDSISVRLHRGRLVTELRKKEAS
jgi:exodeoxyribonuclease VII large subunit